MLGHYARDCSKENGTGMPRSAPLNMLSAQELSQEHYTLIASLQNQVSLQQQLLSVQATLARHDNSLTNALGALGHPFHAGATMLPGVGTSLASLPAPTAVAQSQMILGGEQLAGYVYIRMNQGQAIWGHADIVQASITDLNGQHRTGHGYAC